MVWFAASARDVEAPSLTGLAVVLISRNWGNGLVTIYHSSTSWPRSIAG